MQYRPLGKTGWDVSVLSLGASPLGSVFRDLDAREGIRTVHFAIDQGINFIDVSPYYGLTKAETVLGKALKEIPRDKFILATKVGRYGVDDFDFSPARVVASVEQSMKRLIRLQPKRHVPISSSVQSRDLTPLARGAVRTRR